MAEPETFYVIGKRPGNTDVPIKAKFLKIGGVLVRDPNRNISSLQGRPEKYYPRDEVLYLTKNLNGPSIVNSGGYILVPADYQIENVLKYSAALQYKALKPPSLFGLSPLVEKGIDVSSIFVEHYQASREGGLLDGGVKLKRNTARQLIALQRPVLRRPRLGS